MGMGGGASRWQRHLPLASLGKQTRLVRAALAFMGRGWVGGKDACELAR